MPQISTHDGGVLLYVVFFNHTNNRKRGRHGDGVAAKGRKSQAWILIGHFRRRDGDSDGHSVTKTLCGSDDVRLDVPMFNTKPLIAGAAPGSLHFISNKQAAVLASDLHSALKITRRRHDETADAKYWLRHEGRYLAGGCRHDQFFNVVGAGEATFGVGKFERTTVTIRRARVNKAGDLRRQRPPGRVTHRGQRCR